MSHGGDPPFAADFLPGQSASERLSDTDAERLIAWHWVHPEAATEQHVLAALFDSATAPPTGQELSGEAAAVASFVLATSGRTARHARAARHARIARSRRQTKIITAGIVAASVVGLTGAATADVLPGPVQELAHHTFGAPAPGTPAPRVTPAPAPASGTPAPRVTPAPASGRPAPARNSGMAQGKGRANGKAHPAGGVKGNGHAKDKAAQGGGNSQGNGKALGNGKAKGNGNGGTATPGRHRSSSPSLAFKSKGWPWPAKRYVPQHAHPSLNLGSLR